MAEKYEENLAPAIPRLWRDEIAVIGRDLRVWVRKLPEASPATTGFSSRQLAQEVTRNAFPCGLGALGAGAAQAAEDARQSASAPPVKTIDALMNLPFLLVCKVCDVSLLYYGYGAEAPSV